MASEAYRAECMDVDRVLPTYLRKAIPFKTFNRIQTNCLETWASDSNIIINAPTGTGKTICFELSILRHVHKTLHAAREKLLSSNCLSGKIVYIAPTKSLCSERHADWQQRFSYLGMNVELATGDSVSSNWDTKLCYADLVITTAEMWDCATRRKTYGPWSDLCVQVSLLLLDEVHHIGEQRGAVMESVVTRMIMAKRNASLTLRNSAKSEPVASLRIIAASATVGNIRDLSSWLKVPLECIKCFDESFRPVTLEYHVIGYTAQNPWLYTRVYERQILKVLRQYGEGKPAIVFCTSRNQTITYAQTLLTQICALSTRVDHSENVLTRNLSKHQRSRLQSFASKCSNTLLATLIPYGIAVHNADVSLEYRRMVEELFKESLILCLFSTSTLAQGVNLPARLVIIAGTALYSDGQLREYNRNKLLQMCGRAGRLGLDGKGVAVILTTSSNVYLYQNIRNDKAGVLESRLNSSLETVINAEVARHAITDIPTATIFIKNSFFWVRLSSNLPSDDHSNSKDDPATAIASKTIENLVDMNLVRFDEDLYGVEATIAGAYMAEHCISMEAMKILGEMLPNAKRPSHVLRIISSCPEVVEGVFLRRSEKKKLNELNQYIRMPVIGKVKDAVDKIFILLQIAMNDRPSVDTSLRNESNRLLQAGSRLCSCIIDLLLSQALPAPYDSLTVTLQVSRAFVNKCSWNGSTVFRQIQGMTFSHGQTLWKNGISSITDLAALDTRNIANILSVKIGLANNIRQKLRQIPRFTVEIEIPKFSPDITASNDERMTISVDIASQIGNELRGMKKLRGFILVNPTTERTGDLFCRRFDVNDCIRKNFVWSIPSSLTANACRIDVLVGCDSIVGVDWFGRYFYDHKTKQLRKGADMTSSMTCTRTNSPRRGLSVTTGRVSKKSLPCETKSRMGALKHSFIASMKKITTAEHMPHPIREPNNEQRQHKPHEVVVVTPIADAKSGGQDRILEEPFFGSRCDGVNFRQNIACAQFLGETNLHESVKGEAREYDEILRGLY